MVARRAVAFFVHPSNEAYGADKSLLRLVALTAQWADVVVVLLTMRHRRVRSQHNLSRTESALFMVRFQS